MKIFLSANFLLMLAVTLGRLSGFLREVLLGNIIGVGAKADTVIVLLTLPDLFVNLILSGGMSVALMPLLKATHEAHHFQLLKRIFLWVTVLMLPVILIVIFAPSILIKLIVPGLSQEGLLGAGHIFLFIGLSILLTAYSGVTTVFLNSRRQFFVGGIGTLIFNIAIILSIVCITILPEISYLYLLALGVFCGALIRIISQIVCLRRITNISISHSPSPNWGGVAKNFSSGLLSVLFVTLIPVCIRFFGSYLGDGQIAMLNYVIKLIELPVTIFVVSNATIIYVKYCEMAQSCRLNQLHMELSMNIGRQFILTCLLTISGLFSSHLILDILFGRGVVASKDIDLMGNLFFWGILSLPLAGISSTLIAYVNAIEKNSIALKSNFFGFTFFIITCLLGQRIESSKIIIFASCMFYAGVVLYIKLTQKIDLFTMIRGVKNEITLAILFGASILFIGEIFLLIVSVKITFLELGLRAMLFASSYWVATYAYKKKSDAVH